MENLILIGYLFIIYSFLGWIGETIYATLNSMKIVNRGLINGPFCVIYGFAGVFITIFLKDLKGLWLFLACVAVTSVIEWIGGHLGELLFKERWWDYSKSKWNIDGYVEIKTSIIWGLLGVFCIICGNDILVTIFNIFPKFLMKLAIILVGLIIIIDAFATLIILSGKSRNPAKWQSADDIFDSVNVGLTKKLEEIIERRINKAYPNKKILTAEKKTTNVFAYDCSFYKIAMIFFIGAFIGDLVETIYCWITSGVLMSRSSVVWGPFSVIWGLAMAAATLILYRHRNSSDSFLFLMGALLGGTYEYICSVFTELAFGTVFWDYSDIPFNIGGRINLLYCFFWGIAAVVWLKLLYPILSNLIEKIPKTVGVYFTWVMIVFMLINMFVSASALIRYNQRESDIAPTNPYEKWLDNEFPNNKMEKIYPNASHVD